MFLRNLTFMERGGFTYIMTNRHKTTFYTGVTSDLYNRIYEHRNHVYSNSFTARYNIEFLIYFEFFDSIEEAINREKELKGWKRSKKIELIKKSNPELRDLTSEIEGEE